MKTLRAHAVLIGVVSFVVVVSATWVVQAHGVRGAVRALQDSTAATSILLHPAGQPPIQTWAMETILASDDPVAALDEVFRDGKPGGRAHALVALHRLDPELFRRRLGELDPETDRAVLYWGCMVGPARPVAQVVAELLTEPPYHADVPRMACVWVDQDEPLFDAALDRVTGGHLRGHLAGQTIQRAMQAARPLPDAALQPSLPSSWWQTPRQPELETEWGAVDAQAHPTSPSVASQDESVAGQ